MIQQKEFRDLCKDVSLEFPDLSVDQIEEIVRSQFAFAQKHISEGSLTPIYFQYLGRFIGRKHSIAMLKNRQKRNDTNIERKLLSEGDSSTPSKK